MNMEHYPQPDQRDTMEGPIEDAKRAAEFIESLKNDPVIGPKIEKLKKEGSDLKDKTVAEIKRILGIESDKEKE